MTETVTTLGNVQKVRGTLERTRLRGDMSLVGSPIENSSVPEGATHFWVISETSVSNPLYSIDARGDREVSISLVRFYREN